MERKNKIWSIPKIFLIDLKRTKEIFNELCERIYKGLKLKKTSKFIWWKNDSFYEYR